MRNLAPILLALLACGPKSTATSSETSVAAAQADAGAAVLEQADALWEERGDEAKLTEALDKYAAVVAAGPNRHALIRLTRGWYFYGDAFATEKDVKVERWTKALEYGNQCIELNAEVSSQLKSGAKPKDAIQAATVEDVGCIYWTATALGKWGKIQSLSKTLKHLPTVKAYVTKADALDPSYYHYGPARYWGAYYAALPSFAGQDLDKSAQFFEAAIKAAPYYLPTRVLRAEYLAVSTQNVKQFDADLDHVINTDPNLRPDAGITPENIKDIEKAKALVAKRHELFDQKAIEEADAQ